MPTGSMEGVEIGDKIGPEEDPAATRFGCLDLTPLDLLPEGRWRDLQELGYYTGHMQKTHYGPNGIAQFNWYDRRTAEAVLKTQEG